MRTAKNVMLTAVTVIGLVLLICLVMWSHMSKQAAAGDDHHELLGANAALT